MKRQIIRSTAIVLALVGLAGPRGLAADPPDTFAREVLLEGTSLELRGQGRFTYWRIPVYDAALYLPPRDAAESVLEATPKRLEIVYHRKIPAERIVSAGDRILRRNLDEERLRAIAPDLSRINQAYQSVGPGDRYSLSFHPARGTELALNGELLVTLPGAAFAELYFHIWFGADPVSPELREALWGRPGAKPR